MTKKFSELRDKMSSESRARSEAKAKEMLEAMTIDKQGLRQWATEIVEKRSLRSTRLIPLAPETVIALLDELDRKDEEISERDGIIRSLQDILNGDTGKPLIEIRRALGGKKG